VREHRRFARVKPSGLVPKDGKIIVDAKSPPISCTVIDLSVGGACLFVAAAATLPKRFVLVHGKTKKNCLVMWKAGCRLGVAF
jgi:hypothetical protein